MKDTGGPIKSYNIRWRMMKRSRSKHKPEKWNISSQQVIFFLIFGTLPLLIDSEHCLKIQIEANFRLKPEIQPRRHFY